MGVYHLVFGYYKTNVMIMIFQNIKKKIHIEIRLEVFMNNEELKNCIIQNKD